MEFKCEFLEFFNSGMGKEYLHDSMCSFIVSSQSKLVWEVLPLVVYSKDLLSSDYNIFFFTPCNFSCLFKKFKILKNVSKMRHIH